MEKKVYYLNESETRTVLGVHSMVWANPEKTIIDCTVLFQEFIDIAGAVPYTANKFDPMAFGREFFKDIEAETWGLVEEYRDPSDVAQLPEG